MIPDDKLAFLVDEAFGDAARGATIRQTGSGVSHTISVSLNLADVPASFFCQPPWSANRSLIESYFGPILAHSRSCPGRGAVQCCQAEEGEMCCPRWIEREDPEWYAQRADIYMTMINKRIADRSGMSVELAADEAFELGQLFQEARIKLGFDHATKRSDKVTEGARLGGKARRLANRGRLPVADTVADVERLVAEGRSITRAYAAVGRKQGVSAQTIAKEYRRAKKPG